MTTENPDNARNLWINIVVIGIQIILGLVLAGIIASFGVPIPLSLILGIGGWAMVVFSTKFGEMIFIIVEPNTGVVLRSQLRSNKLPGAGATSSGVDPRTKLQPDLTLRELSPGIHCKLPWEVVVEPVVDLRTEVLVGEGQQGYNPLTCYTSDGVEVRVGWQIRLTPLQGYLSNYVRRDMRATMAHIRALAEQSIRKMVSTKKEDELSTSDKNLKEEFTRLFDGDHTINEKELQLGIYTNTPQIQGVTVDPEFLKTKRSNLVAKNVAEAIAKVRATAGADADPNLIAIIGAGAAGSAPSGVTLIPGIGSMTPEMIAAIAALAGGKKEGKS